MKSQLPRIRTATRTLLASLAAGLLAPTVAAQASYFEGFENAGFVSPGTHGPAGLIAAGWDFRNQSAPVSSQHWTRWNYSYQGLSSLHVDQTVSQWQSAQSRASSWCLLPAIPGQVAGDSLGFQLSSAAVTGFAPSAHLEVRYSPSGGTSTGSGPDDVGDFTTLLADLPDPQTHLWSEHSFALPGSGRVGLRFVVPPTPDPSEFFGNFQLDNLVVGTLQAGPPIPAPGQTVTWTQAMSPISITQITTIPAGGTVIVDPGVTVDLALTARVTLQGDLIGVGLPGQPVTLQGFDRIEVYGTLQLQEAVVGLGLYVMDAGTLTARDASFQPGSYLFTGGSTTFPPFLDIDRCTFASAQMRVGSCTLRLTSTSFSGSYCEIGGSSLFLQNASFDSGTQEGLKLQLFMQPVWIDDVTVTNSTNAGLDLQAVNAAVGPNVSLVGNEYPVQLSGGGFVPGSLLPALGNLNDYVHVVDASVGVGGAGSLWPDTGVPYVIVSNYIGNRLEILPGARIQLGPLATFWGPDNPIAARGTPADPVVFERLNPSKEWQGLQYFHRFENCLIDGGQIGARFHSITFQGFIDNCVIQNCDYGMQNDALVRKTRFVNNGVGSWGDDWPAGLDGATGGNSFEGNGVAVQSSSGVVDAPNNWWGDPTGPNSPDNPGGLGQTAIGATTVPFLTTPPDFGDTPPMVRLEHHSELLEAGSKVILTWSSSDDVAVVSHRIEFEHPLGAGATQVLATDLPGTQQAWEWTVPDIGFAVNGKQPRVRVVAVDSAGQEGWDASDHLIPSGSVQGPLTLSSQISGPFVPGTGSSAGQLCWDASGLSGPYGWFEVSLVLDADRTKTRLGITTSSCLPGTGFGVPFVSTDSARIEVVAQGTANHVSVLYSEPFAIRPDPRLGDAPPSVTMISPLAGQTFAGGSSIPIAWTAADDEGLSAIHVQASYDAGRTWHFIAEDLPGTATSHTFELPPSSGVPDVRLRVIAVDRRFQNSSDGADRPLSISTALTPPRKARAKAPRGL